VGVSAREPGRGRFLATSSVSGLTLIGRSRSRARTGWKLRSAAIGRGVVVLENGLQTVGEGVGGAVLWARKAPNQAVSRPGERRDRTQEVAGSSPASSIKTAGNRRFFFGAERLTTSQALGLFRRTQKSSADPLRLNDEAIAHGELGRRMLGECWGGRRGRRRCCTSAPGDGATDPDIAREELTRAGGGGHAAVEGVDEVRPGSNARSAYRSGRGSSSCM
jgi:hypothetical protein